MIIFKPKLVQDNIIPALIGAGAAIGGTILSNISGSKQSKAQRSHETYLSDKQTALQREFAKSGVQWKVEDAKKAGVHPLAALGANTISYSPQQVGTSGPIVDNSYANMGQDISRAVMASANRKQRSIEAVTSARVADAQIKNMELKNALLEKELNAPSQIPPNIPDNTGFQQGQNVQVVPDQVTASRSVGKTAGVKPLETDYIDSDRRLWQLVSQDASEPMESDWFANLKRIGIKSVKHLYGLLKDPKRPTIRPPKGHKWQYQKLVGMWQAVKIHKRSGKHVRRYRRGDSTKLYRGRILP